MVPAGQRMRGLVRGAAQAGEFGHGSARRGLALGAAEGIRADGPPLATRQALGSV